MRCTSIAVVLALAACASNPERATSCGCSNANAQGFGFTNFGLSTFADTDNDGLPDTRLPDPQATPELANVWRANCAVLAATNPQQLDTALAELAAAVADARSKLAAGR